VFEDLDAAGLEARLFTRSSLKLVAPTRRLRAVLGFQCAAAAVTGFFEREVQQGGQYAVLNQERVAGLADEVPSIQGKRICSAVIVCSARKTSYL
jgi:hypothetical protein